MTEVRLGPALLTVLGFLAAVGPFATDLYLPALPAIADSLGVDASGVQLTLTAFLLGIGSGQLVWGPLSDRFGRRRVMVSALAVFAAASLAMVFVPNLWLLVVLRLVQGFTGSAGIVVARAVAVDLSAGAVAVRALSMMATVGGVGMLIAPLVGGVTSSLLGWRGTLAALALVTVAMFVLALTIVPETLPRGARHADRAGDMVRRFGVFLRDRTLVGYTLSYSLSFAGKMAYIAASSFVAQVVLGVGPVGYAVVFAASAAAFAGANLLNGRIAPRLGPSRLIVAGLVSALVAGTGLVVLVATGALTLPLFVVAAILITGGAGFIESNSSALALARAETHRGTAAALLGSSQFLLGAAISPLVGLAGAGSALPMAVAIVVCMGLSAVAATVARTAHGRARGRRPVDGTGRRRTD